MNAGFYFSRDPLHRMAIHRRNMLRGRVPGTDWAFFARQSANDYRAAREAAMKLVTLPSYTPDTNVVHPVFQKLFRQLGLAA